MLRKILEGDECEDCAPPLSPWAWVVRGCISVSTCMIVHDAPCIHNLECNLKCRCVYVYVDMTDVSMWEVTMRSSAAGHLHSRCAGVPPRSWGRCCLRTRTSNWYRHRYSTFIKCCFDAEEIVRVIIFPPRYCRGLSVIASDSMCTCDLKCLDIHDYAATSHHFRCNTRSTQKLDRPT